MRLRDKQDSTDPHLWFRGAADRLRAVDIADHAATDDIRSTAISLLHRATELYLKGYLLAIGGNPEKTQNIKKLIESATGADDRFGTYSETMAELDRDFRLTQYPGGDLRLVSNHLQEQRGKVLEVVSLIRQKVPQFFAV